MTEDQLEQETLGWLADVGYTHRYGPDIAHDGADENFANHRLFYRADNRLELF